MNKLKIEYIFNAILYCIWLYELKSQNILSKIILMMISPIPKYMLSQKYKERYYKYQKQRMIEIEQFNRNKIKGYCIGYANHWFGFIYSSYAGIVIFPLFGIMLCISRNISPIIYSVMILLIILIIVGLWYIPAYKAVFSNDLYLKYFKRFEKEDKQWHKKWNRITILFGIGGVLATILGIISAICIIKYL